MRARGWRQLMVRRSNRCLYFKWLFLKSCSGRRVGVRAVKNKKNSVCCVVKLSFMPFRVGSFHNPRTRLKGSESAVFVWEAQSLFFLRPAFWNSQTRLFIAAVLWKLLESSHLCQYWIIGLLRFWIKRAVQPGNCQNNWGFSHSHEPFYC